MSSQLSLDVMNAATLEKILLTKQVGGFLSADQAEEKRSTVENVARLLAQDVSQQVREALAFELRTCMYLPHDLAARIASDVESVSSPFLASTNTFTDMQLAGLIPHLAEHAHITLAKRSDLGRQSCMAIVTVGSDTSVSFLVRNEKLALQTDTCETVIERFDTNVGLMDMLAHRSDLPLSVVEELIAKVSEECREILASRYGLGAPIAHEITSKSKRQAIWSQIEKATPTQIHGYVIDLRNQRRLTTDMILEFAGRGCFNFLNSALALKAGLPLDDVRLALYGGDMAAFVALMRTAGVGKATAHEYLRIIKGNSKQSVH